MRNRGFIALFLLIIGICAFLVLEVKTIGKEVANISQNQSDIVQKILEDEKKEEKQESRKVQVPETITIHTGSGDKREVSPDRGDWTIHKDGSVEVIVEGEYYVGMRGKFWPEGIEGPGFAEQLEKIELTASLPVVSYSREGLLERMENSEQERKKLREKLINPFSDYYSEGLIAIHIEVPENTGEQYAVTAIFANGGTISFIFGQKGESFDYWKPDCMGECQFSDEFKEKYPEISN